MVCPGAQDTALVSDSQVLEILTFAVVSHKSQLANSIWLLYSGCIAYRSDVNCGLVYVFTCFGLPPAVGRSVGRHGSVEDIFIFLMG